MAIKRVGSPNFYGMDIVAWLAQAEQYFAINNTRDDTKVQLALVCMEELALHWVPCGNNLPWINLLMKSSL